MVAMYNYTICCAFDFLLIYMLGCAILGSKLRPLRYGCKGSAAAEVLRVGGAESDIAWRDVSWTPSAPQAIEAC